MNQSEAYGGWFILYNPKSKNGINGNQVIRDLIDITEVHSFQEKLPTMSDIFIGLVKGDEVLKKHLQEQA
ncbi:MAG: DUF4162 domain-containing protein [Flammeovirgaceae bacterium]|nr:DUF4162 domain-containing protein [Flammeovirgaceae bacterium]